MVSQVDFQTDPSRYRHWRLDIDGPVATLTMAVDEAGGLNPGYELKLNSYDLGVDIELYDAVQRLRFEHPEVRVVVMTSGKDKVFCAGANIRMLAEAAVDVSKGEFVFVLANFDASADNAKPTTSFKASEVSVEYKTGGTWKKVELVGEDQSKSLFGLLGTLAP